MFDFGLSMSEIMVIAVIALIVVGPKDLPKMLRTVGRFVTKLRGMAGEFQRHLDSAIREAGIEDMKKEVRNMTNFTVTSDVGKQMSEEFRKQGDEIKKIMDAPPKSDVQAAAKSETLAVPSAEPAPPAPAAEASERAPEETKA
jgi:sec-independent protein translocase protein TatB